MADIQSNPLPPSLPKERRISFLEFLNENVINKLSDRDKRIAMWRQLDVFGFGVNEKTYREIGEIEGISGPRVRQICFKSRRRIDYKVNIISQSMKTPHVIVKYVEKENLVPNLPMRRKYITDLGFLSVRAANCLACEGLNILDKLLEVTESELLKIPNFGRKSLNELKELLELHGLKLKPHKWSS